MPGRTHPNFGDPSPTKAYTPRIVNVWNSLPEPLQQTLSKED